ncbi:NUDIX domain-containing protein, partial [Brachybacterium muris]|uniref:NUDIX domain-containing protein n=1 Tax=Brachybacterium muris TaxID=219301 RepID=UPI0021A93DDE|nr:NUDIX domain-containing protein [Brachybacterium muris]
MTPPRSRLAAPRRIVLVAGPSGSGKGEMARRCGLPTVGLDEFYRDLDDPGLPHRFGIVDWDDPVSWDSGAALQALTALAHDGSAEIPVYSISESRRKGSQVLDAGDAPLIVAEGIFAAELIGPLASAGLLADALVLDRPTPVVFGLRLARDLAESRKPPLTLLRRGWALAGEQQADVSRWREAGMRPLGLRAGTTRLRRLTSMAEAERNITAPHLRTDQLRITAVCFLREGAAGPEVLAVRKHGTGSYMQVGGKLEGSEESWQAAIREVHEELGVMLEPGHLELLGEYEAPAANEPDTVVHSTAFVTRHALPEPLAVQAELAEHRWIPLDTTGTGAGTGSIRLAPLMVHHILPALR